MAGVYQVVAECAHVTLDSPYGRVSQLVLKDAFVPGDAPELPRLLDLGYVVKVDGAEPVGTDPVVATGPAEPSPEQQVGAEVAEKRAAAKAKLDALGDKAPDGRSSEDVLVEYLAARGYDYAELIKQDKEELIKLLKQS